MDRHDRCFNLCQLASNKWALLHELRHIRHQREGTGADPFGDDVQDKQAREFSCDESARKFLLDQADAYAADMGVAVELVRRKRQIGIYFGLFSVTLLAKNKWQASDTHPSVQARLDAVCEIMEPTKSDLAAAIAHVSFANVGQLWSGRPTRPGRSYLSTSTI